MQVSSRSSGVGPGFEHLRGLRVVEEGIEEVLAGKEVEKIGLRLDLGWF